MSLCSSTFTILNIRETANLLNVHTAQGCQGVRVTIYGGIPDQQIKSLTIRLSPCCTGVYWPMVRATGSKTRAFSRDQEHNAPQRDGYTQAILHKSATTQDLLNERSQYRGALKCCVEWTLNDQDRYPGLGGFYDAKNNLHIHLWRTNTYCGLCSDCVCDY